MMLLYRSLIALHPVTFRKQFGPEMEWIFDESGRPSGLLLDVITSLARQWVLRTKIWIFALAALGGTIPFALAFGAVRLAGGRLGVSPVPHRHLPTVARSINPPVAAPFLMLATVIALMFISGTMIFAITWFRYSQKRRNA